MKMTDYGFAWIKSEHGLFFTGGKVWSHRDTQNTVLGIFWAITGSLGIYLSRGRRRSILPAFIIIITGWTLSSHEQSSPYSDLVHAVFGYTLMAAGLSKLFDVYLFDHTDVTQVGISRIHLTPFLLTVSGVMFLSATDQQLRIILVKQIDHPTYALIQISVSAIIYFFVNLLISLYGSKDSFNDQSSVEYTALESFDKDNVDCSI